MISNIFDTLLRDWYLKFSRYDTISKVDNIKVSNSREMAIILYIHKQILFKR